MAGDWLDGGGSGAEADVHEIVSTVATQALLDLVQAGALVSMGTTSDGGALGVTVTVDGRWRREYFRDEETLRTWLAEAVPGVQEILGSASPTSAQRKRSRRSRAA